MVNGPLTGKLLRFAFPVMLSGILQLLFNTADVIIVGRFTGKTALAAVGSTGALINLIVSLFMGISIGSNVLIARYYGGKDRKKAADVVHTSIAIGIITGLFLLILGIFLARPLLLWMDTPSDVIDQSVIYMKVLFLGTPVSLVFNFGASILRGVGDTKRPLYYLTLAGVINVILNLILVTVFDLGVLGVAVATVVSQTVSCILTLICLMNETGMIKLYPKKIRIRKRILIDLLKIGIPAGLQGCLFSVSNVLIQSSINSFDSTVMAASTAAGNLEGFVYVAMNSVYQTNLSFTSQNYGAGKYDRVREILKKCMILVSMIGLLFGGTVFLLGRHLLWIYNADPAVISTGVTRLALICIPYFLFGLMDVVVGTLRGIGYQLLPMFVSLAGICGLRIVWIYTIFARFRSFHVLLLSYPITWIITFLSHLICYFIVSKKLKMPKKEEVCT